MHIDLPSAAIQAIEILESCGHRAYVVGGCVRDACRGEIPHDWDMTTSARPEETAAAFAGYTVIETGIQHGTVTVLMEGQPLEITTFRTEGAYADHRHPDGVTFVRDLEADLVRRDFMVNAMAYHPREGLIDPFGGREDIQKGILRAVGDPDRRFEEDALRILRGLRFAARLGYTIEEETRAAMSRKAHLLCHVSVERILEELRKLVMGEHILNILLTCSDVLAAVLPEIFPMVGFDQNNRHHIYDVWTHTAHAVTQAESDPIVRLAMLFHDVGKPASYTVDFHGEGHFYAHAKLSGELTDAILQRLKCDTYTRTEVVWLVTHHDYSIREDDRTVRRLLSRFGYDRARRLLLVKMADNASHAPEYTERGVIACRLLDRLDAVLAQQPCLTLRDLALNGRDLMAMGYTGPAIGKALQRLLDAVVDGLCENDREALIAYLNS
ncbi:MAG: HD domain-containing protein [Clostridia bacterium]|nr:HD domain-containing protein [Clostridia bacterium]